MAKFMLSMADKTFGIISSEAKNRGVTIQELLRAVVVPEWARENLPSSTVTQPVKEGGRRLTGQMSNNQRDSLLALTVGRLKT